MYRVVSHEFGMSSSAVRDTTVVRMSDEIAARTVPNSLHLLVKTTRNGSHRESLHYNRLLALSSARETSCSGFGLTKCLTLQCEVTEVVLKDDRYQTIVDERGMPRLYQTGSHGVRSENWKCKAG